MSVGRARTIIAELMQRSQTLLLAVLLELPSIPLWAHGKDAEGRAVFLVGRHRLVEREETGAEFVKVTLEAMQAGEVPAGVHTLAYAPKASEFIATIVSGQYREVLGVGPRESGKSQAVPGALSILAEMHEQAGFPLPLRVLMVNESLVSFAMKMGRSLVEPLHGGCWSVRNDSREAVLTIGGVEYVLADAVGATDDAAAERLKTRCHVVAAEELTASLNDSKGIPEDRYTLAVSSISLPTSWPGAIVTTNPAGTESWVRRRFVDPGQPGCTSVTVPGSDRLSPDRIAELRRTFSYSPEQVERLIEGRWVDLPMGAAVTEGLFDEQVHVGTREHRPLPQFLLGLGFDGGHSPSCVIGQRVAQQIRIYAAFNLMGAGVLELIEQKVLPWLREHAPWALEHFGASLVHLVDPSMKTASQTSILESPARTIEDKLGGRVISGATRWAPRREAVLQALAPRHEMGRQPFVINPGNDTTLLVQAYSGRWYYPVLPNGQTERTGAKKPNSPWSDLGDASAYLLSWLYGSEPMATALHREIKVESRFNVLNH